MKKGFSEHDEQRGVITWAKLMQPRYPELYWLHAIPNGGLRNKIVAAKMKAEGMKAGVPDLFLPVSRKGYHGLYIEMKRRDGGKPTDKQKTWIHGLNEQGYLALICHGAQTAIKQILKYLEDGSK